MKNTPDEYEDDVPPELSPEFLAALDGPPEPWLAELAHDALPQVTVPREAMWNAIQKRRQVRRIWPGYTTIAAIAATLVIGVGIGRYLAPNITTGAAPHDSVPSTASVAATQASVSNAVLNAALAEHLVRSEALLTAVRYDTPRNTRDLRTSRDVAEWARDLLGTTHLLLDDPTLRDARTRHLLEDLELVLVQVVQARNSTAPLVLNAPAETLRETNLLPRVRAASTSAPVLLSNSNSRGITE